MARIIDDRGRLFGKINIVDILVLVVVIAVAVFVGLRATDDRVDTVPVNISFLVQPTESQAIARVHDSRPGERHSRADAWHHREGRSGATGPGAFGNTKKDYELYIPSAPEVLLLVSAQGTVSGTDVHVGSVVVRVGAEMKLIGPGWEGVRPDSQSGPGRGGYQVARATMHLFTNSLFFRAGAEPSRLV